MGKAKKSGDFVVDFGVAFEGGQGQGVQVQDQKKKRGRPSKMPWQKKPARAAGGARAPKKPKGSKAGQPKAEDSTNNYLENNYIENISREELKEIITSDNGEIVSARALNEQLTVKELKFLEIYFQGDTDRISAMKSAGYDGYSESMLYLISRKIVEKYESGGPAAAKVFRAIGFGELKVAMLLKDLAINAKSEIVRADVTKFVASCLGMAKSEEVTNAFQIVFNPPAGQPVESAADQVGPAVPVQVKAVQITR